MREQDDPPALLVLREVDGSLCGDSNERGSQIANERHKEAPSLIKKLNWQEDDLNTLDYMLSSSIKRSRFIKEWTESFQGMQINAKNAGYTSFSVR